MDRDEFEIYPKIGGHLVSAVYRCFLSVSVFEDFLRSSMQHAEINDSKPEDLSEFIRIADRGSNSKSKGFLWAMRNK